MNLYQYTDAFRNAINSISLDDGMMADAGTGEVYTAEQYTKVIDDLSMARDEKIKNCLLYVKSLEGEEKIISSEIARIQALKKTKTNKKELFKKYILENVELGEKLDFSVIKLSVCVGAESVVIDNSKELPQKYLITQVAPDKIAIKKALKQGVIIDGAELLRKEKRLLIK